MSLSKACLFGSLVAAQMLGSLGLSYQNVVDISNDVKALITRTFDPNFKDIDHPILGSIVRLNFHDCAGRDGCDGCVNLDLPENSGLEDLIKVLEPVYLPWKARVSLSRADFWALAGFTAVNMGIGNVPGNPTVPALLDLKNFQTGRRDCAASYKSSTDEASNFPPHNFGQAEVQQYFSTYFKFNTAQTVAILGAHNLGKAHDDYSGFNESWTRTGKQLGTEYFQNMLDATKNWDQAPVDNGNYRWIPMPGHGHPPVMMLDSDMSMYKNFRTPTVTGQVACGCSYCDALYTPQTSGHVQLFARSLRAFLDTFADAFTRMLAVCGRPTVGDITPCSLVRLS